MPPQSDQCSSDASPGERGRAVNALTKVGIDHLELTSRSEGRLASHVDGWSLVALHFHLTTKAAAMDEAAGPAGSFAYDPAMKPPFAEHLVPPSARRIERHICSKFGKATLTMFRAPIRGQKREVRMKSFTHPQPSGQALPRKQRLLAIGMLATASWAILIMAGQLIL